MKNIVKIFILSLILSSCGDFEPVVFDEINGETGIGFANPQISLTVPVEGVTSMVNFTSTTISDQARNFTISVDMDQTTVTSSDYSLGTATIPANSHEGTLDVTFNYDGLEDFVENTLVLNVEGDNAITFSPLTFKFIREFDINEFVCADLSLSILFDNWGSENTWEITDSTGMIVVSGGPYSNGTAGETAVETIPTLPSGDYTFTFYDSYGDGLFDGVNTGNYSLFCTAQPVVSYASASGNFGSSNSTEFTIN